MRAIGNVPQGSAQQGANLVQSEPGLYRLRTRVAPERALAAFGEMVEAHGGEWDAVSGSTTLVLQAGVRHGIARGHVRAVPQIAGSELIVQASEERWALDRSMVLMLVLGALAGLVCVLWPFFPLIARFVPIGLVLGASVWLAVLSRLRHLGIGELLAQVERELEEE